LFGDGLKKNFIYDMINFIPAMLRKAKFEELCGLSAELFEFYKLDDFYKENENGFFRLISNITDEERVTLKELFKKLRFSALNFTDSRAVFQFYNLNYLWMHVKFAIENDIKLLHLAVESVSACEIYRTVKGEGFINEIADNPPNYDYFKTLYANKLYGIGSKDYIFDKQQVLKEIKEFTASYLD